MMNRLIFFLTSFLACSQVFSFPCFFTLAKDNCWTNYDVKVVVMDATSNQQLTTIDVPKGQSWGRQAFTCQPGQKLIYYASFQPVFWQSDVGKTYMALHYWLLPTTIATTDAAWDVPVCFPIDFAAVPIPPDATTTCNKCDFTGIPPVKVQQ